MAPTAIQTTSELTLSGQAHVVAKTAPSIYANGAPNNAHELDASRIVKIPLKHPRAVPEPNSAEVWAQNVCTDHMITCKWTEATGWNAPRLEPYGPFSIMPTASVLHYATECFEGLRLYRGYDSRLRLFRPDCNARRMLNSATRISLPAFDPVELQKMIEFLCSVDGEKWLPKSRPGTFLYLRPTMIATADNLGVQKPKEALLYVIACCFPSFDSPTGTHASPSTGSKASVGGRPGLKLLASREDTVRAWPGGFGFAKLGANYGPSLIAQAEAKERGFDQVLWLLGKEGLVTEAGASNFFVVWRTREGKVQLVTAPLGDKIILDGVTRRSVLQLARERLAVGEAERWREAEEGLEGLEIAERAYTMDEVAEAVEEGRLIEAFAAGTAFFIASVSKIHFRGKDLDIPLSKGVTGTYTKVLKGWLGDIMYGIESHEWGVVVEEKQV